MLNYQRVNIGKSSEVSRKTHLGVSGVRQQRMSTGCPATKNHALFLAAWCLGVNNNWWLLQVYLQHEGSSVRKPRHIKGLFSNHILMMSI